VPIATCSAIVIPALSCASKVEAPRCGTTTTDGSSNSGDSVVGFLFEHVEGRTLHVSVADASARGFVDDATSRDVDDAHPRLVSPTPRPSRRFVVSFVLGGES